MGYVIRCWNTLGPWISSMIPVSLVLLPLAIRFSDYNGQYYHCARSTALDHWVPCNSVDCPTHRRNVTLLRSICDRSRTFTFIGLIGRHSFYVIQQPLCIPQLCQCHFLKAIIEATPFAYQPPTRGMEPANTRLEANHTDISLARLS